MRRRIGSHLTLTRAVALLSLLPMIALGFILTRVLQSQIDARTVADARHEAQLIARIGVQPRLTPGNLERGLAPGEVAALDRQLRGAIVTHDLARIKIWNARHVAVYSDDHALISTSPTPSDDLLAALAGRPPQAQIIEPQAGGETASEVGLGRLVEDYVPLRFAGAGRPAGAFEIYISYSPIAAAVAGDKRTIAIVVTIGLALLWAMLFPIVARASKRLRRQARENYRLARYDQLTGLPNRTLFVERLGGALPQPRPSDTTVAVLLLDLDRFKHINNTLGDAIGDGVLREVAARLVSNLGKGVLVARTGGDEFAILAARVRGLEGACEVAREAQAALEAPIELEAAAPLNVETSVGVAVAGEHSGDADALLQHADAALARARAHGGRIEVFSPQRDRFDASRLVLLGQVRGALEREEFVLHYQPKVDMRSGRVTGVEALLRWRHPEQGLLAPASFIPLVEQTALVGPLTLYVVDRSLAQLVAWRRGGLPQLTMSVNLSARNLVDSALVGQIAARLERWGVAPCELIVEVTESAALADRERAIGVLAGLRAIGVGVSIDDFGAGNASIEYLAALPANEIKLDKSFITGMLEDARAEAIVRSTIDLAGHLAMSVVAEGIETQAVLDRLVELGCDSGQGYLISPPLPAEELGAWLWAALGLGASAGESPFTLARPLR
jgi:diguanylate cyclase (GGDEF)-like protein